jgi:hypothetical protein
MVMLPIPTLKMEAADSFETQVNTQWATHHHTPEKTLWI